MRHILWWFLTTEVRALPITDKSRLCDARVFRPESGP